MKINNINLLEHLNIIEKNQLNIIKNKLKKLFNLIVNFKKLNSVIYFIGFSEFSSKKYYKFLKQFNIISLNNETWVNGLISNSVYMNKYLRKVMLQCHFVVYYNCVTNASWGLIVAHNIAESLFSTAYLGNPVLKSGNMQY